MSITITSELRRDYDIRYGRLDELGDRVRSVLPDAEHSFLVTDDNVFRLYGERVRKALINAHISCDSIVLEPGENAKTLANLGRIITWALSNNIDRRAVVIALGGGVIGDLAGFFAATILRGVRLVHVPTTITAQVDSSIGGKTGVNHSLGKNLIGAFYPPELVFVDTETLQSLPRREVLSGLAEVVKHALLSGGEILSSLALNVDNVLNDHHLTDEAVRQAAAVKARIVMSDEFESDQRVFLNFGHTFGHAIEQSTNFTTFTHGEAVAIGMAIATTWSNQLGGSVPTGLTHRLIAAMNINPDLLPDADQLIQAMSSDKKAVAGTPRFVLLHEPGKPYTLNQAEMSQVKILIELVLGNLNQS